MPAKIGNDTTYRAEKNNAYSYIHLAGYEFFYKQFKEMFGSYWKILLKIAEAFALQFLIRDHYYATEVRKSELSRATLSFFPKTKCPIFAYPNDSTAKSTIEPPFRMLNFIKNLHIFSILIICIILDLVYGSATSFIHYILYSFTSKSDYLASCHIDHCHMKDIGQVIPPPEASITHPRSSLRYEIYQSAQFPHTWSFLTRITWSLMIKSKEEKSILRSLYSAFHNNGREFLDAMAFALFIEVAIFKFLKLIIYQRTAWPGFEPGCPRGQND